MEKRELKVGDIVQINPDYDPVFGASLMIVTEPKQWGAQGYVQIPGKGESRGQAYYRCKWENMELVGTAEWIRE